MSSHHLTGTYLLGHEPMVVLDHDGGLVVALTGVSPEFGARLVAEGNHFRLEGGQLGGSTVRFAEGDPSPGRTVGEVIAFTRALAGQKSPGCWDMERLDRERPTPLHEGRPSPDRSVVCLEG